MSSIAARRYAQALFDMSSERKNLDDINQGLKDLMELIGVSPGLDQFLKDPTIA